MPELGRLSRAQAAALGGLAPINRDSGTMRGKREMYGGRTSIRNALYMPALVAIRHNDILHKYYTGLLARGKPKKVAIGAVMRKLLVHLNALMRVHLESMESATPERN